MKKSIDLEVIYTELPWAQRFHAAKRDGYAYVEFWNWDNKDLDEVSRLLKETGLKVSAMSGDNTFSLCDPTTKTEYIEYIKQSIAAAKKVGCPCLVIHSNALNPATGYAVDYYERYSDTVKICAMFDNLRAIVPLAEEADITFVLEPLNDLVDHKGNYLVNTRMAAELIEAVGSEHVKVLYDAYHMYLTEGKICETVSAYFNTIAYVHIADAPGRAEPGTGAINYRNFLKHLADLHFDGFVGFEFYPKDQKDSSQGVKAIEMVSQGL